MLPVVLRREKYTAVIALIASASFVLLACALAAPIFETNDDVQLSMIVHGYGIAATASPRMVFSNVIWGHVIRAVPTIHGVLGYSIVTLGVLIIVGGVLCYGLITTGAGVVAALAALTLLLARPVLIPQYTINAGMLMVAAIVCWRLYERRGDVWALIAGCVLAYAGYLVRDEVFALVLIIGAPLLPWRTLRTQRSAQIAVALLMVVIAASAGVDRLAYRGAEWRAFDDLNAVRVPYNDFGAGDHLKEQPQILRRHGFSGNDIDLITNWFFDDPTIADPAKLAAMLDELGPLSLQPGALLKGWNGVANLWSTLKLLPLFFAAAVLAVMRPSRRIAITWVLCVGALFAIGLSGRPGIIRIYIPVLALLVVAPLLEKGTEPLAPALRRRWAIASVVVIAAASLLNGYKVLKDSNTLRARSAEVRAGLANFPTAPVALWGDNFPYESAYPVLGASREAMRYRLYQLDVFTLAPYSVPTAEKANGHALLDRLLSKQGMPIVVYEYEAGLLRTYCSANLHGTLRELARVDYGPVPVRTYRCERALSPS